MSFFLCALILKIGANLSILAYPVIDLVKQFITELDSIVRRLF